MNADQYQNELLESLSAHFRSVEKEWSVSRLAEDLLAQRKDLYVPRLDIAVGPFAVTPGNHQAAITATFCHESPSALKDYLARLEPNPNPRCALAIEVAFSGSSKHVLGDITNAGMMGLYGLVVTNGRMEGKACRIVEYARVIGKLGKGYLTQSLFSNVAVISQRALSGLLRETR